MEKLRILIADDHPMFCHGIRMLLESKPDFEVVGEAASGKEAIEMVSALLPDLVLMIFACPG